VNGVSNDRTAGPALRRRARLSPAATGVALLFAASATAGVVPLLRVESQSYSEPMALQAAFDDWRGEFLGGKRQWTFNWAEVGLRGDHWSLSVLSRLDFDLRFSRDTAEFYYLLNSGRKLTPGKQYDIALSANSFSGVGVRGALYVEPTPRLQTAVGLSLFKARELQEGDLSGTANALTARDYQYRATVDYYYAEDKLFHRPVEAPDGMGLSLDLSVKWQPHEKLRLSARVVDLLGAIQWTDAPFTRATATSATVATDADGTVHVVPALSGVEGYEASHIQHLDPRVALQAEAYPDGHFSPVVSFRHQAGQSLGGVGARSHWGRQSVGLHLWPSVETVGVEYGVGRLSSALSMDNVRTDEARTLWLNVSYAADL